MSIKLMCIFAYISSLLVVTMANFVSSTICDRVRQGTWVMKSDLSLLIESKDVVRSLHQEKVLGSPHQELQIDNLENENEYERKRNHNNERTIVKLMSPYTFTSKPSIDSTLFTRASQYVKIASFPSIGALPYGK